MKAAEVFGLELLVDVDVDAVERGRGGVKMPTRDATVSKAWHNGMRSGCSFSLHELLLPLPSLALLLPLPLLSVW